MLVGFDPTHGLLVEDLLAVEESLHAVVATERELDGQGRRRIDSPDQVVGGVVAGERVVDLAVGPAGLNLPGDGSLQERASEVGTGLETGFRARGGVVGLVEVGGREGADVVPVTECGRGRGRRPAGQPLVESAGQATLLPCRYGIGERFQRGIVLRLGCLEGLGAEVQAGVPKTDLLETAHKSVVIVLWQRVVLVAVAPGTPDRQSQQAGAQGVNDVVELFVAAAFAFLLGLLGGERTGDEKPGGRDGIECRAGFGGALRIGFGQQVTGDLQADEPVVGHVLVERADDEVPILVGVGPVLVEGVSVALGKSHQIQPVAAPAFSVVLAGQQPVDLGGPCRLEVLFRLGQESLLIVGRWREADHVEVDSAEQRGRSRPGIGREPFGSLGSADEPVDVGSNHVSIGDCRRLGFCQRLE